MTAEALEAAYRSARAGWPGVEISRDVFAAFLLDRSRGVGESLRLDEIYLACACARGDAAALAAFERSYFGEIGSAVARFGPPAFVDEVKQEVRQKLFTADGGSPPKIAEYAGRGGLSRWLRAVAVRTALNLLRGKGARTVLLDDEALLEAPFPADDPELAHMKELYRAEFKHAFREAMAALEDELRTMLRLYYIERRERATPCRAGEADPRRARLRCSR